MKLTLNKSLLLSAAVVAFMASCKKDKKDDGQPEPGTPDAPAYYVPTTYNFASADFSASSKRLAMLGELATYMRSAHTTTQSTQPVLDAQKMKDMYANTGARFADASLNSSGLQLKDQTGMAYGLSVELDMSYTDAAAASASSALTPTVQTASSGTAGKLNESSTVRAILVDANGLEYKEQTEKGIMGGVFYYQAMTKLANINTYDNTTLVNGITAQEKAWDEAFGYFGVPVDFPTNLTGLKNWGSYANSVNVAINCNATIMNAFLKGRAAISNKDNTARDAARDVVMRTWEKVAAAKCISYMKGAKTNFTKAADRHHNLSEGIGFIKAFSYNPSKTISTAQIAQLQAYMGTNLYNVTTANIDNIIGLLATTFSLDPNTIP
jgi:hypothetical protein